jgi:hypothetical protein
VKTLHINHVTENARCPLRFGGTEYIVRRKAYFNKSGTALYCGAHFRPPALDPKVATQEPDSPRNNDFSTLIRKLESAGEASGNTEYGPSVHYFSKCILGISPTHTGQKDYDFVTAQLRFINDNAWPAAASRQFSFPKTVPFFPWCELRFNRKSD